MLNNKLSYAISINQNKEAALYFDYFIPYSIDKDMYKYREDLGDFKQLINNVRTKDDIYFNPKNEGPLIYLLPPEFINEYRKVGIKSTLMFSFIQRDFIVNEGESIEEWGNPTEGKLFMNLLKNYYNYYLNEGTPILYPKTALNCIRPAIIDSKDLIMNILDLELIDTEMASWEQIIEFRKKTESKMKLRRLKHFVNQTYIGKDIAYIEDDLFQRIYDYQNVVKDWGFKTRNSILSNLISSKSLFGTVAATFMSLLFNEPFLTASAAVGGTFIEISKISIDYSSAKNELKIFKRDHPLNYIFQANNSLKNH